MKLIKTTLFLVLIFLTINSFAQNADAIINDYYNAVGGRDKIGQVKSLKIESTMNVMGNSTTNTSTIADGKGFKSEVTFNGQNMVQAVNDTSAWMINPMMGSTEPTSLPKDQFEALKEEIYVGGPLLNYKNNGYTINYAGTDTVNGKTAYKIDAASKGGFKCTFYFDSTTHLMNEKTASLEGQNTVIKYSNYQKTDGYMMPFNQEILAPQGVTVNITVNKVTVNPQVDLSMFKKP